MPVGNHRSLRAATADNVTDAVFGDVVTPAVACAVTQTVLRSASGMVGLCREGEIFLLNPEGHRLLGVSSGADWSRKPLADFFVPDDRRAVRAVLAGKDIRSQGRRVCVDTDDGRVALMLTAEPVSGDPGLVIFSGAPLDAGESEAEGSAEAAGELSRVNSELSLRLRERTLELTQQVFERHQIEDDLRLADQVIAKLTEGVVILDANFKIRSVNPAYCQISGYAKEELIGQRPPFADHSVSGTSCPGNQDITGRGPDGRAEKVLMLDGRLTTKMCDGLREHGRWEGEYWSRRRDGGDYAERLSITALRNEDGEIQDYAAVVTDVTKRKQDEERILYQANYDGLTGLPNRVLFVDRLDQSLAYLGRRGGRLSVMFIDLDGFKLVNDTLGHDIGDLLLKEAASRLETCIRSGDTVARLGGDEFTILMPEISRVGDTPLLAQRVLDALSEPFLLNGNEAFVSASIGITVFPDDGTTSADLLRNADAAMYRAKEQGKANYKFFTADLNKAVQERLVLKNGLSKALERNEFQLFYQPKLDIQSGEIVGVEALMRWENSDLGMVSPARFIPVLEESGLIIEVGTWVIKTACEQHNAWVAQGLPAVPVAVNLSARQLREVDFAETFESIMQNADVGPEFLEIEVTESMIMTDSESAVIAIRALNEIGIRVAMDDFGTGYSSLSYLKKFPIDTIKIDRSFVADITTNQDDAEIIRTIITMGQTLNRKVVAEGVETAEQMELLRAYRCDQIQGYFLSPPLPAERFGAFIAEKISKQTSVAGARNSAGAPRGRAPS